MRCGKDYWPAAAFTFCATFKRDIIRPKTDPQLFFFSNLFINGQAFINSGKENYYFFSLLCNGVQGKRRTKYYQYAALLLLIYCENNYETAVTFMNPRCQLLVRRRQLLIRWKKSKWAKRTKKGFQAKFPFCSFF